MAGRWEALDSFLGRLVFRTLGLVCLVIALAMTYAAWSHVSAGRPYGWTPPLLFGLAAIAAASCIPFCFSRRRNFGEALDAMEGGAGDIARSADIRKG